MKWKEKHASMHDRTHTKVHFVYNRIESAQTEIWKKHGSFRIPQTEFLSFAVGKHWLLFFIESSTKWLKRTAFGFDKTYFFLVHIQIFIFVTFWCRVKTTSTKFRHLRCANFFVDYSIDFFTMIHFANRIHSQLKSTEKRTKKIKQKQNKRIKENCVSLNGKTRVWEWRLLNDF